MNISLDDREKIYKRLVKQARESLHKNRGKYKRLSENNHNKKAFNYIEYKYGDKPMSTTNLLPKLLKSKLVRIDLTNKNIDSIRANWNTETSLVEVDTTLFVEQMLKDFPNNHTHDYLYLFDDTKVYPISINNNQVLFKPLQKEKR